MCCIMGHLNHRTWSKPIFPTTHNITAAATVAARLLLEKSTISADVNYGVDQISPLSVTQIILT